MLVVDIVVIASLLIFCIVWWLPSLPKRELILPIAAGVALLAALVGMFDYRWQVAGGGLIATGLLLIILINRLRGVPPRKKLPWISGPIIVLFSTLGLSLIYFFPIRDLPAPSGPHPVGVSEFELSDKDRKGTFADGPDEPRRLLVRVWYPADNVLGLDPRTYFTDAEMDTTATGAGVLVGAPFMLKAARHIVTNAYPDAPILTEVNRIETLLPTIFFSHGFTSFAGQNTILMEELASHGYVVFSIHHTYESTPVVFNNGDVISMDPALSKMIENAKAAGGPPEMSEARMNAYHGATIAIRHKGHRQNLEEMIKSEERLAVLSTPAWIADKKFVLDQLQHNNVPEKILAITASSNLNNTGHVGMSFGGVATTGFCMEDPRCSAAINIDGGEFNNKTFGENIPVPFMMLYSDYRNLAQMMGLGEDVKSYGFNDFAYERPETASLRSDVDRFLIVDGFHMAMTDYTWFIRRPLRNPILGALEASTILSIQRDFTLGFFDRHLRNVANDFPRNILSHYESIVLRDDSAKSINQWWLQEHPEDETLSVIFETSLGEVEFVLYPQRAPLLVAEFLAKLDAGDFNGARLYRSSGDGVALRCVSAMANDSAVDTVVNDSGLRSDLRLGKEKGLRVASLYAQHNGGYRIYAGDPKWGQNANGMLALGRVLRGLPVLEKIQSSQAESDRARHVVDNSSVLLERSYRSHVPDE